MPSRIVCTGVEQANMETWLGYRMGMNGQETIRLSVKSDEERPENAQKHTSS